ncbi:hypothetical protein Bbelb_257000 [Branchiostoma belcheri]|nr:hypothetical protein Bbelb_257000 [Branchiostoma belcheri]
MKNVTCVINTWEKTHLHVFTAPMSSTPDGTVCEQQTETVFNSPYSTLCTEETKLLTTEMPTANTTKTILSKTNPVTTTEVTEPYQMSHADNVQQYSEISDQYYNYQNTSPESPNNYWYIPDSYFNYKTTRPASLHQYWEIPDEYFNYQNSTIRPLSYPLTLHVTLPSNKAQDNTGTVYNAAAKVALASSTRQAFPNPRLPCTLAFLGAEVPSPTL